MRRPQITTRGLMITVAAVALALSPGVLGPGPDECDPRDWAVGMAATNLPAILIIPVLFRLGRSRSLLVLAASAAIAGAQVLRRVPPNLYAVEGYLALGGIAHLARDDRDLGSAFLAVFCGVLVGLACGHIPCTQIEIIIGPLVGIIVRRCLVGWAPPTGHDASAQDRWAVPTLQRSREGLTPAGGAAVEEPE